jgi:hypothetical protein
MPYMTRPYLRFPEQDPASSNADPLFKLPLAYGFGFGSLLAFLVLSGGPLDVEWVRVEGHAQVPELQTVYVNPDSIRREGNLVSLRQLTDFHWKQGNPKGTPRFSSTMIYKQFDCTGGRLRLLAFTEFPYRMGAGRPAAGYVDKDHWLPVRPGTVDQTLWELACEKR